MTVAIYLVDDDDDDATNAKPGDLVCRLFPRVCPYAVVGCSVYIGRMI
jgi:hypothetical protein